MSESQQGVITIDNIEEFVGKVVDCEKRAWHYYPLKISKINGEYYYTDRNKVSMPFHKEDKIAYDSVTQSRYFDAMTERFDEVAILGKPALFTDIRLDRATIPRGYHVYEVRHDDDCQGDAVQLARNIAVNHWGTLIARDPIRLPADGYLDIEPDALNYDTGDCQRMNEFMEKYPAKPPKNYER